MLKKCQSCKANKVCDHNKYGFENCNSYIPEDNECDVIRWLDDLGRVLIPKEIRRELGTKEGDELSITLSVDKTCVVLRPVKKGGDK